MDMPVFADQKGLIYISSADTRYNLDDQQEMDGDCQNSVLSVQEVIYIIFLSSVQRETKVNILK